MRIAASTNSRSRIEKTCPRIRRATGGHPKIARLHPVEIADLVEALPNRLGAEIVESLDDATAADVVEELDVDGHKASSSAVRAALQHGDIPRATRMLGRPYQLSGIIQRGEGLGAQIGFPTANIHIDHPRKLLPRIGVYAARVAVGTRIIDAMMNIGTRPTVSSGERITVEAHLFDFAENIYGVPVEVSVIERIRDEQAFPSVDALAGQLTKDRETVRAILASRPLHSTIP